MKTYKVTMLTPKQIKALAMMATKAHKAMVACGCPSDSADDFRHEETYAVVGKTSLHDCTQGDYIPLYNHFAMMLGIPTKGDNTWTRQDKAMWRLTDAMRKQEIDEQYLLDIVADQFRGFSGYDAETILEAVRLKLDAESIIKLSYTVISRGREKTRKINTANDINSADITEPHAHKSTIPPGGLEEHFNVKEV